MLVVLVCWGGMVEGGSDAEGVDEDDDVVVDRAGSGGGGKG